MNRPIAKDKHPEQTGNDWNITSARIRALADEFRELKASIYKMQSWCEQIREQIVKLLAVGRYEQVSVYQVSEVNVKAHKRSGYKAIRPRL